MKHSLIIAAAALLGTTPLSAQDAPRKLFVEGLAGAAVPTFDIADVATTGSAFGVAVGYRLTPRWVLMGEFDYGMHQDKPTESVDINTTHLIAKLGYAVTTPAVRGWDVIVNLGAGVVNFDVDGAEGDSYFAINAGAKIAYNFSPSLALVLSPQGDIAFTKEDELGSSSAWVWPITAGIRISF
ncbi:MAG TPA: outer membrane beta-barrel protein [Gemmatimonadaceae bacterium]